MFAKLQFKPIESRRALPESLLYRHRYGAPRCREIILRLRSGAIDFGAIIYIER